MPEVERAVAAGRVAHVGGERLPRRGRQLPAAPSGRAVEQQQARAQDEIEFAEHQFVTSNRPGQTAAPDNAARASPPAPHASKGRTDGRRASFAARPYFARNSSSVSFTPSASTEPDSTRSDLTAQPCSTGTNSPGPPSGACATCALTPSDSLHSSSLYVTES